MSAPQSGAAALLTGPATPIGIAIDWLPIDLNPFVNKRLFDDRLMLIARRDHPTIKVGATFEDLLKVEFVGPNRPRDIEHLPPALEPAHDK